MRKFHWEYLVQVLLFALAIYGQFLNLNYGYADNGDFGRLSTWVAKGPIGFKQDGNLIVRGGSAEEYENRYHNYWLPAWKYDFPRQNDQQLLSSTVLLILPGTVLNALVRGREILSLPVVSLFPRLLVVFWLGAVFIWINKSTSKLSERMLLTFGIGIPLTSMFSSIQIAAYLNSFYQEMGSFVFLLWFVASLVIWRRQPNSPWRLVAVFISAILLAFAKSSNIYWFGIITITFLILIPKQMKLHHLITTLLWFSGMMLFIFVSLKYTAASFSRQNTAYNSLYFGVLVFSQFSQDHLQTLGLPNTDGCVDFPFYDPAGGCIEDVRDQMSYLNTFRVIRREPLALLRFLNYVSEKMQDYNTGLGMCNRDSDAACPPIGFLTWWHRIRLSFFPKGLFLWIGIVVLVGVFLAGMRYPGILSELGWIGLVCLVAMLLDMVVAILGDGKQEIVKHLFLSNVLFDLALITGLNLGLLLVYRKWFVSSPETIAGLVHT